MWDVYKGNKPRTPPGEKGHDGGDDSNESTRKSKKKKKNIDPKAAFNDVMALMRA